MAACRLAPSTSIVRLGRLLWLGRASGAASSAGFALRRRALRLLLRPWRLGLRRFGLGCALASAWILTSASGFGGLSSLTLPPAFSTASMALCEAPVTSKASLALSSPLPSRRTPSRARRMTTRPRPARRRDRRLAASSLPGIDRLLDAAEIDLVVALGEDVVEAALGQAPIERHLAAFEALMAPPERAVWPLPPRPASCRGPSRCRGRPACALARPGVAQFVSRISFSSICLRSPVFDDAHQMAATLAIMPRTAGYPQACARLCILFEPKADQRRALDRRAARRAADLLDRHGLALARLCHRS